MLFCELKDVAKSKLEKRHKCASHRIVLSLPRCGLHYHVDAKCVKRQGLGRAVKMP
jgi:hypothetical protein